MNLSYVPSREYLIVGGGKIPRNEIDQVHKELAEVSDAVTYSCLQVSGTDVTSTVLSQLATTAADAQFISYGAARPEHPEWQAFEWVDGYLTNFEENDLVVLWMLDADPSEAEVTFIRDALDVRRSVLVMNEGLWEVDRIDSDGMYEKLESDDEPEPEDPEAPIAPIVGTIAPNQYSGMDRSTLKRLVTERNLEADKRSIESMIKALTESDLHPQEDEQTVEDTPVPEVAPEPAEESPAFTAGPDISEALNTASGLLTSAAAHHEALQLLNTQLANVLLELNKELRNG